ncbi:hypothetical protein GJA_1295 [Janthinobacterium agaricidamnosum NBRC 102515 = DSM 9628]|uniref:Uncharacterized protein n=1 Tax=Janthinobacterium agaricidamnosum NBRC 102515 = DSM 9628 TaxID=1349767 RepID=W0V3N9_9BURK|nr:hypothetical protein GJA_1295 [Janthinobacterium agaricidamnosum NBRC 102515 = DSM 9628]
MAFLKRQLSITSFSHILPGIPSNSRCAARSPAGRFDGFSAPLSSIRRWVRLVIR